MEEAQAALPALFTDAKIAPVAVVEDGGSTAVVMSLSEYERITGARRTALADTVSRMRAEAAAKGLTEEKLAELLADDS
jgi:PHD/YefM family antitoxin component YafN of YafNO toxin-antitoxin module